MGYKQKHYLLGKFQLYAKCVPVWEGSIRERELMLVRLFHASQCVNVGVRCTQYVERDCMISFPGHKIKIPKTTRVIVCYFRYFD
jgi:hypothetical protein